MHCHSGEFSELPKRHKKHKCWNQRSALKLTTCDLQRACLPVHRVELEVHRTREGERDPERENLTKNENIADIENIENIENIELKARPTREGERDPEEKILTTLEYIAGGAYIYLSNIWTFSNQVSQNSQGEYQ